MNPEKVCECGSPIIQGARFCEMCGKSAASQSSPENQKPQMPPFPIVAGKPTPILPPTEVRIPPPPKPAIPPVPPPVSKQPPPITNELKAAVQRPTTFKRGKKIKWIVISVAAGIIAISLAVFFFAPGLVSFTSGSKADFAKTFEDGSFSFGPDWDVAPEGFGQLEERTDESFPKSSANLSADEPVARWNNVEFKINSLEGDARVSVTPMTAPPPMPGAYANAFKFNVEMAENYNGLYTITLPLKGSGELAGAGYFNERTRQWEPVYFEHDKVSNKVVILTDHLSTYASFTIEGEGTRYARISSGLFEANDNMSRFHGVYADVLQEALAQGLTQGGLAYNLGKSVVDDWFKASGAILEMEGLLYSSSFLSDLSNAFTNVGIALSLAQLAVDYSRGDQQAMAIGAFNTAQGWAISKWGTKALKVSMIGVMAIDYSLTKLREQVIGGREEAWTRAYLNYYSDKGMSNTDWYYRILEISNHAKSPEQFQRMLDNDLTRYADRFWNEPEDLQGEYQSNAMGHAWSGGGGKNPAMQTKISGQYKADLLYGLEPVFRRIEREVRYQEFKEYQQQLSNARELLNQRVKLVVKEKPNNQKPRYGDYIFQLGPLKEGVDFRQWTGRLNKDGSITASFTVLGHLAAGAPSEIRLFKNRKDFDENKPIYVQQVVMDVPETTVVLGGDDFDGVYKGEIKTATPELAQFGMSEVKMGFTVTVASGKMKMEINYDDGISFDLGAGMKFEQSWVNRTKITGTCENGNLKGQGTMTSSVKVKMPDYTNSMGGGSITQDVPSTSLDIKMEGIIKDDILEGEYYYSFMGEEVRVKLRARKQ